ncbi:MAG: tRNA glutamyl-Q(34) synthetase GluQRS [Xanthomonadales bacterium]|nr:tRNA glutamyl-Q(34) synthetase GluQRS [Xanthomonadales bacterium]
MAEPPGRLPAPSRVTRCRGRFAPSPTGLLHFGSLVAAVGSWLFARAAGGEWIVRMEDLDPARSLPGAAPAILDALAAFGLASDGPVLMQGTRTAAYAAALKALRDTGDAFPCWCSRSDLEPCDGLHPGRCITPPRDRRPAWRLRVGSAKVGFDDRIQGRFEQDLAREVGDFVIWRADGVPAYQLAVVVDDAAQDITEVVRGADLLDSTPRQILLQRRLGLPQPTYAHLPLALDACARKLSKQDAAAPVDPANPLPALRAVLGFLGQRVPAATTPRALLEAAAAHLDIAAIPRTGCAVAAFAAARNDAG